jgi:hypothetical protein
MRPTLSVKRLSVFLMLVLLVGLPALADHEKRDQCPCPPPPPPPAKPILANGRSPSCPPNSPNKEHRIKRDVANGPSKYGSYVRRDSPGCPPNSPVKEYRLKTDNGPGSGVPKPPPPERIVLTGIP